MTRKGSHSLFLATLPFTWASITMRWEVATLHWCTCLTQSPRWKSSWWVDVSRSISSKRSHSVIGKGEAKARVEGRSQGWEYSSARSLSHSEWAHTRHRTCTKYDVNRLQCAWLTPGILTLTTSWSLEKHSIFLPVLFQNNPIKQRCQARTKGKDLPEQNAVRPDVTQCGVEVVEDALGSHPLHGEEGLQGRR